MRLKESSSVASEIPYCEFGGTSCMFLGWKKVFEMQNRANLNEERVSLSCKKL
jgi:hypothetical protein